MATRQFSVLNWNVGGARFLEEPDKRKRGKFRNDLNRALNRLVREFKPDVIALQEIVEYSEPDKPLENIIKDIRGYVHYHYILINTATHPYVGKWRKVEQAGKWPPGSLFGQGNAILWREKLPHFPVWSLPKLSFEPDHEKHVEEVILMSGLYLGDRNTEPRAASVSHFVIPGLYDATREKEKPLDIFVVNLHLTTLMGEREGIPQIDEEATRTRQRQLNIVLNGIVSRYNDWRRGGYRFRGERRAPEPWEDFDRLPPIWILCGDFNFTPESAEYAFIRRMNFVDLNPKKGRGTKGKGFGSKGKATIICDYIFAGPKYISMDPIFTRQMAMNNTEPIDRIKVSDHYPLVAKIPLSTLQLRSLVEF